MHRQIKRKTDDDKGGPCAWLGGQPLTVDQKLPVAA
jgi:hypothetical protein